jgi:hypothetical protein
MFSMKSEPLCFPVKNVVLLLLIQRFPVLNHGAQTQTFCGRPQFPQEDSRYNPELGDDRFLSYSFVFIAHLLLYRFMFYNLSYW